MRVRVVEGRVGGCGCMCVRLRRCGRCDGRAMRQ
eukprot:SAG22_NODE_21787_length_254_cov_0.664516_1_plen_33_part_10